jgi:Mn-dependent DtxR family transcriptional regulator
MGQQEIYDYLKKNKARWFTSKDISKGLKVSIGSVTSCLKKLRHSRTIHFRTSKNRNQYEYKFKR